MSEKPECIHDWHNDPVQQLLLTNPPSSNQTCLKCGERQRRRTGPKQPTRADFERAWERKAKQ